MLARPTRPTDGMRDEQTAALPDARGVGMLAALDETAARLAALVGRDRRAVSGNVGCQEGRDQPTLLHHRAAHGADESRRLP
jgi:hypothetical protein